MKKIFSPLIMVAVLFVGCSDPTDDILADLQDSMETDCPGTGTYDPSGYTFSIVSAIVHADSETCDTESGVESTSTIYDDVTHVYAADGTVESTTSSWTSSYDWCADGTTLTFEMYGMTSSISTFEMTSDTDYTETTVSGNYCVGGDGIDNAYDTTEAECTAASGTWFGPTCTIVTYTGEATPAQ